MRQQRLVALQTGVSIRLEPVKPRPLLCQADREGVLRDTREEVRLLTAVGETSHGCAVADAALVQIADIALFIGMGRRTRPARKCNNELAPARVSPARFYGK